eukprot:2159300-Rhodomonas_salina.1
MVVSWSERLCFAGALHFHHLPPAEWAWRVGRRALGMKKGGPARMASPRSRPASLPHRVPRWLLVVIATV